MTIQQMTILIAFITSIITGMICIPLLHKLKANQAIRDDGPQSHLQKAGTPTLGGLIFLIPLTILGIIAVVKFDYTEILPIIISTLAFGVIGMIDDLMKILLHNSKGISPAQKMLGLIIVSTALVVYMYNSSKTITEIMIPFTSLVVDLKILFIPFSILVLLATTNSINLTDGLDGLVGGVSTIIMLFFSILSIAISNESISILTSIFIGALLGFLVFNLKPAKVFMGDAGSLALGGAIGAIAIQLRVPLILIIIAIIPVIETLSVIIQVTVYKSKGKRVFKMTPIHHHFELSGFSEQAVVYMFWTITFLACVIGLLALVFAI